MLSSLLRLALLGFVAAFDSVSHIYLDQALAAAGASDHSRFLFRAIYQNATGCVRCQEADGTQRYSEKFDINRGNVQGDIVSPIFFVVALQLLFPSSWLRCCVHAATIS